MFARIKRSAGRAYLVLVENERVPVSPREPMKHRQREVARVGRVDHMTAAEQEGLVTELSRLLAGVRVPGPKHGRGLSPA